VWREQVGDVLRGALEPLAFLAMALFAINMYRRGEKKHPNKIALSWTLGTAIMSFVGAGLLGIAHTIPGVNMYTHGTLVTAMHGHLAFWGAYGATKAAVEDLVRTWADELENTTVRAALIDPGAMRTKMRAEAMPGEDPMDLPHPSEIGPLIVAVSRYAVNTHV